MAEATIDKLKITVSADTSTATKNLEKLQASIEKLSKSFGLLDGLGDNTFTKAVEQAKQLETSCKGIVGASKSMNTAFGKLASTSANQTKKVAENFTQSADEISALVDKAISKMHTWDNEVSTELPKTASVNPKSMGYNRDVMDYIDDYVKKLDGVSEVVEEAENHVGLLEHLKDSVHKLGDGFTSLGKKIASSKILRSFEKVIRYRTVSLIINQITDGLKEGADNLYQYSKLAGTSFAENMDSAATSLQYFRNSLGAMAEPILNNLIPIFDSLIDKVVDGVNWLNQLFAVLSGSSSWTKAIRQEKEYADSATEAATATKRLLASFDQLNIIGSSSSGGSGSKTDYSTMFEEMPIDTVGDSVIEWGERFKAIFDVIKENVGLIGAAILTWKLSSTFLGGIDSLNDLKVTAGLTIAVVSFAMEYDAIKKLVAGEVTTENICKAIVGGLGTMLGLSLAFGSVAGGTAGLIIGLVGGVTVALVSWKTAMNNKARQEYENSEFYKQIVEWNGDHERHLKVIEEIELHFTNYEQQISDIETSFAEAKVLMDEAFYISDKPIKTLEDTLKLQSILEQLESHGIHLDFDGSKITTAKDDAYELLNATKELMLLDAYKERLSELYGDFANAQIAYDESLENYESANKELVSLQTELFNNLSETAKAKLDISEPADISLGKMNELYKTTARLGEKFTHVSTNELSVYKQKYVDLSGVINDAMGDQVELREDMTKIEESIDKVSKHIVDLQTTTDTATTNMGNAVSDMESLGKQKVNSLGSAFTNFANSTSKAVQSVIDKLKDLTNTKTVVKIDYESEIDVDEIKSTVSSAVSGRLPTIKKYANGGRVGSGQLFISHDAGAELVGKIGGSTNVVNNEQIIDGIEGGVARGIARVLDSSSSSSSGASSADIAEQNKLLREQNKLLSKIADKELTISPSASLGRVVSRSQKLADALTGG